MKRIHSASMLLGVLVCVPGLADEPSTDKGMCSLHQVQLVQVPVPILYGKPLTSEDYSQACESQFPNARERCVIGGCIPKLAKNAKVMVCPKCSEVRQHWLTQHQVKDARI